MDALTISLALLGGVVLAGVVAHGAWSARRAALKHADPAPEPREPVLDAAPPGGDVAVDANASAASDKDAAAERLAAADLPFGISERRLRRRQVMRLDALIDAIAPLTIDAPMHGDAVTQHLPATRRAGGKPFLIEGLNAASGAWEPPSPGERYLEFQAGVQLANRTGALNEIEYSEFVQKVQAFADPIGAMADFPDMLDVVARARELDQFASEHDAQLAVRLRARSSAWSVAYLRQHSVRHGFLAGVVPGRLVMPAVEAGAPPPLTLTFDAQAALADDPNFVAVREATLNFDVPQTAPAAGPFAAWRAGAEALSQDLDAALVDDSGQPLSAAGFDAIGQALGRLYEALEARDLAAGSAAARRLFS